MADTNKYTGLIAGYHSQKKKYTQWIYELTNPFVQCQKKIDSLLSAFDIDNAVGDQLDAIGVRVGITRKLQTKISDVFFALDDVDGKGFDFGIWKTPRDSATSITELSDEIFRVALNAKVALNHYSGDNESLTKMINGVMAAFGVDTSLFGYTDNQDMTVSLYLDRPQIPPIVWEIFYNKIFSINHAGVEAKVVNGMFGYLATTSDDFLVTQDGDFLVMEKQNG